MDPLSHLEMLGGGSSMEESDCGECHKAARDIRALVRSGYIYERVERLRTINTLLFIVKVCAIAVITAAVTMVFLLGDRLLWLVPAGSICIIFTLFVLGTARGPWLIAYMQDEVLHCHLHNSFPRYEYRDLELIINLGAFGRDRLRVDDRFKSSVPREAFRVYTKAARAAGRAEDAK